MKSSIRDFLPRQLALNDVKTTETFTLKEIQLKGGETDYQSEYELHKAPIKSVKNVTAKVDGNERKLEKGIDYTVNQKSTVEFLKSGTTPDIGSDFDVTYVSESILSRYIDSIEEGTDKISDEIGINKEDKTVSGITASKYISTASEDELEEIGKLFGELGKRGGRDVERYRQYLKSIAKVYTGSGRKKNVAEASATVVSDEDNNVEADSIEFEEYFDEQEFAIRLNEFESHRASLLYNVVDLADPSGVRFVSPIYSIDSDDQEYVEGPKPDLFKYDDIDSLDAFDDDFISPFNHKSPDKGEYPSSVTADTQYSLPDVNIETEQKKPIEFEWAEKIEDEKEFKENGGWSEFQWGSGSWSGDVDSGVTFTGADWEFADWNELPYTDLGTVGADSIQTSESVSQIVSSRLTEESVVSAPESVTPNITFSLSEDPALDETDVQTEINNTNTDNTTATISSQLKIQHDVTKDSVITDPTKVTPNISFPVTESVGFTETNLLEITLSSNDTSSSSDNLDRNNYITWNENNWSTKEWGKNRSIDSYIDETKLADNTVIGGINSSQEKVSSDTLTTVDVTNTTNEATSSNELLTVETSKFVWDYESWDTMKWSEA